MKKKARKKLLNRLSSACYSVGKLILFALVVAFFLIQFDTMRMTFIRAVVSDTLKHCPRVEHKYYETLLPEGALETVHQDTSTGHRDLTS